MSPPGPTPAAYVLVEPRYDRRSGSALHLGAWAAWMGQAVWSKTLTGGPPPAAVPSAVPAVQICCLPPPKLEAARGRAGRGSESGPFCMASHKHKGFPESSSCPSPLQVERCTNIC